MSALVRFLACLPVAALACSKANAPASSVPLDDAQPLALQPTPLQPGAQAKASEMTPLPFGISSAGAHRFVSSGSEGDMYNIFEGSEEFNRRVRKLLKNTKVNNAIVLADYISLQIKAPTDAAAKSRLEEIWAKGKPETQTRIMTLIGPSSRPVFQFWLKGDVYSGNEVEEFWTYLHEEGEHSVSSPAVHPDFREPVIIPESFNPE